MHVNPIQYLLLVKQHAADQHDRWIHGCHDLKPHRHGLVDLIDESSKPRQVAEGEYATIRCDHVIAALFYLD